MKTIKFLRAAFILLGILLSACAAPSVNPSAPANVGSGKSLSEVIFTGTIESMNGDQWVINGQTVKVDSSVLRDGPFVVGDTVKVEALVASDGSVTAQRLETPSTADSIELSTSTPAATEPPTEVPNIGSTPVPGTTNQTLVFDNTGTEAFGTVDSLTATSITLNGQIFNLANGVEIKNNIAAGMVAKLHFIVNADGSLSVREIEIADPMQIGSDNSADDGTSHDVNDDHGGDGNSSDDGSDHDSNDDHGGDNNSGGNSGSGG